MSARTLLVLNGSLLLLLSLLYAIADSRNFWEFVFGVACVLLLAIVANGVMFFKALWCHGYLLAMEYLGLMVGAVALLYFLPAPHKIGG